MKLKFLLIIILLLTQAAACDGPSFIPQTGNATTAPTQESDEETPIGKILNIRTQVYAGEPNNLQLIKVETDLGNNEFVRVEDGGKARLSFPGPISLLLYNQSEMDDIRLEFDENSNPRIVNRLIRGGFSGYVEPGHQLTIDLSFGIQVNVLGTNFFIIVDDQSGYITIGKYDGTLSVSVRNQDTFFLKDAELIDIDPQGNPTHYSSIPFTPAQFDRALDSCMSPIQGFKILRRDNNLPQPGEVTLHSDLKIDCEPLLLLTMTPEILTCIMPTGFVKAKTVILRDGPDLRFYAVGRYKQDDRLTVLGWFKDWYHVEFPTGDKGWLYTSWVTIPSEIDPAKICEIQFQGVPPPTKCVPDKYFSCPP